VRYFLHNNFSCRAWSYARDSHCQRHTQTSIADQLGFYSLRSMLDWLIKRSFTPGQACRCKLRVYCNDIYVCSPRSTSIRRHFGIFKFSSWIWTWFRGRSRGRFMLCNSFIIVGLLDLSAFPSFVRSRFFLAKVFLHVCLVVIRYLKTVLCSGLLASVESVIIWKH